jgi:hypothetical protein
MRIIILLWINHHSDESEAHIQVVYQLLMRPEQRHDDVRMNEAGEKINTTRESPRSDIFAM